jgi:hypothetical protein
MNEAKESSMRRKAIICFLIFTLFLSSCQVYQSMQPINESATSGTLLFSDDFASNANAWGTSGKDIGEILFEYEGLDIKVNTPNSLLWTVTADQFRDTQIEVDGVLLGGPSDNAFGVICRYQDNEHFYGFILSHDGYYGIFKMDGGNMLLADSQAGLKYSDAIRQGGVVNHILAVCQGETLQLTVNDTLLSEVQDSSYAQGQMGLIVGTYEMAGTEVFFDNLQIYQP